MGIPLLSGRDIGPNDVRAAPAIVVVNRTFADKLFPGQNPVGKRLLLTWEGGKNPTWRTIVGLYGDVRHGGLDTNKNPQRMELAVPIAQLPFTMDEIGLVGTESNGSGDAGACAPTRRQLHRPVAAAVRGAHHVTGLIVGLGGANIAARVMRSLLHGVSPADPIAIGGTVAVLLAIGTLGSLLPALRASRIEPTEALRSQ